MKTVIIGGVAAGMSAASKLKRLDTQSEIIVFERGRECSFAACGLPYYIAGVTAQEDSLRIRKPAEFAAAGIDLRLLHEVLSVDAEGKRVQVKNHTTGESFWESYDNLVVATGADAILPPWRGSELAGVFTLKTIEDANRIKEYAKDVRRVTVVGGGYIGLEMVEALHLMGKEITLIEMAPRVLTSFDPEFSQKVEEYLAGIGVTLRMGEAVTSLEGIGAVREIRTDKGSYPAELVIVAVGVRPNTAFLRDTGVAMLKNGALDVDEYMRTSLPDVWAAGDCATVYHRLLQNSAYLPLATNANKQGRYLAQNLVGDPQPYTTACGTAFIKIGELELGRTGLSEGEAQANDVSALSVLTHSNERAAYYPGGGLLSVKLVFHVKSGVLLGAQLLGRNGSALRTDVLAACITAGMTVKQISELDLGYAPPFATTWDALHIAASAAQSKLDSLSEES